MGLILCVKKWQMNIILKALHFSTFTRPTNFCFCSLLEQSRFHYQKVIRSCVHSTESYWILQLVLDLLLLFLFKIASLLHGLSATYPLKEFIHLSYLYFSLRYLKKNIFKIKTRALYICQGNLFKKYSQ